MVFEPGINYEVFFGHWVDCARSQAGVAVHSCVELMWADALSHIVDVFLLDVWYVSPACLNDVSAQLPTRNFAPATFISSPVLAFGYICRAMPREIMPCLMFFSATIAAILSLTKGLQLSAGALTFVSGRWIVFIKAPVRVWLPENRQPTALSQTVA